MKKIVIMILTLSATAAMANGAKYAFSGSDTLAGVLTDALISSGLDQQMQYVGGGSGNGEKGLLTGDQNLAPMSREIKPEALTQLAAQGMQVVPHVLALDGLSLFVKSTNSLAALDLPTVVRIYSCEFTKWEQLPNSNQRGQIKVYRRNDASGTTDAFKHFTGLKKFGDCVIAVNETADISDVTSRDQYAIGYAGLSGKVENNRSLAIAGKAGAQAVLPTTATIRDFSYPMARRLYVYEVTGSRTANDLEKQLLQYITDRSFMDPIMQAHEFITID